MCSSKSVAVAFYQNLTFCSALASFPNFILHTWSKLVLLHASKHIPINLKDVPHPGLGRAVLRPPSKVDFIHPISQSHSFNCELHPGLTSCLQGRSPQSSWILNTLLLTHVHLPLGGLVLGSSVPSNMLPHEYQHTKQLIPAKTKCMADPQDS